MIDRRISPDAPHAVDRTLCAHQRAAARSQSPATDDAQTHVAGTVLIAHNARKDAMNNGNSYQAGGFKMNTPMIVGACLIGAGSLIGLTGMIIGGTAMISAARQWFQELDVPPSEVVKQKYGQTKAATAAGASAWKHHNAMQRANA
ncbi:MAG TPA: hypothetical protein VMB74_10130 [Streptosporangiaceae bacterium]|nr:hypothetical protein [Streptosporangiaceae bacterium]